MSKQQHTIDTRAVEAKARKMDMAALEWNANDAHEAALAAEELERAGCRVSKTGGFYRDEATVYRAELGKRLAALGEGDELVVGQEVLARRHGCDGATRTKVTAIEVDGKNVRSVSKARACREGVVFSLADGHWAHGYQVAARQSADEIAELRRTNVLGGVA